MESTHKKEFLHDLVYTYLDKKRAKWVLPWLINNFEKVGEYFEFPVFSWRMAYVFINA